MRRIRTLSQRQAESSAVDFVALSADISRHFPSLTHDGVARLASLTAIAAMIESDSLALHLMDTAAIILQAEAHLVPLAQDQPQAP